MSKPDDYEGIDLRVKEGPRAKFSLPFLSWAIAGIAIVSFILIFVQLYQLQIERRSVQNLQSTLEANKQIIQDGARNNRKIQSDLDAANQTIKQLQQDLATCQKHRPTRRTK